MEESHGSGVFPAVAGQQLSDEAQEQVARVWQSWTPAAWSCPDFVDTLRLRGKSLRKDEMKRTRLWPSEESVIPSRDTGEVRRGPIPCGRESVRKWAGGCGRATGPHRAGGDHEVGVCGGGDPGGGLHRPFG